jgi:tetratricopeptide (TPR) repeat protein
VFWFRRGQSYDRNRILNDARRAAGRGATAKAIALYERVQEVEPHNPDVLRRLAVQRARAGQRAEAWRDCRAAAEVLVKRGFVDKAIGIYRDFATHLPDEISVWHALAELELERKRPPDAVAALLKGRRNFRSKRQRAEALSLLRRARQIDPTHFEANFELAALLIREGAPGPARRILEALAPHTRTRRERRRLRGRLFRLSPTPGAAWRWLAACFGGS